MRANEVRALADQVSYLPAKDELLRMAEEYEHLARRASEQAKASGHDSRASLDLAFH